MVENRTPIYKKPSEILRLNRRFDAVITTDPGLAEKAQAVFEIVKNGIPKTWVAYSPHHRAGGNLKIDNRENPQFIAKTRKKFTQNLTSPDYVQRASAQRFFSVLNEFSMAPWVARVLASPEAHECIQKGGFDSVRFIPPLVALIDRKLKEKTIIYEWIPGHTWEEPGVTREENLYQRHFDGGNATGLLTELRRLFVKNGIDPVDFSPNQLMVSKDQNGKSRLNIVDIEAFGNVLEGGVTLDDLIQRDIWKGVILLRPKPLQ